MKTRAKGSWEFQTSGRGSVAFPFAVAMEAAMTHAADLGRVSRRIVQKLWDPEPTNDKLANEPAWCLGCPYTLDIRNLDLVPATSASTPPSDPTEERPPLPPPHPPDTPPSSATSSFDSTLSSEGPGQDGGWPSDFLDDFESRVWMTYRTGFEPIAKSTDPRAMSTMSLTMRVKNTFSDPQGFSSDTGWGCMIRSGQSLLANAIVTARLGRGTFQ